MKRDSFPRSFVFKPLVLAVVLALAAPAISLFGQEGYSHARIVRLSFTQGAVSIERPNSTQWEAAPVNTPIEQGYKLSTATGGYAEVQFENSSTARLGEQSELDFSELALAPSGAKINRMELVSGYATFTVTPQNGDEYEVTVGRATLTPTGKSQFRVDLDESAERVEVFEGRVNVASPFGSAQLAKDDVLQLQPGAQQAFNITHGVTLDAWDKWVDSRQQVLTAEYNRPAGTQGTDAYPQYASMWGWNELTYYGNWGYVPGIGYGWTPNLGCGWTPFTMGQWVWYPSFGWTWISDQPWGWLPFHYGYWDYISGAGCGWYWFPGGFNSWSPGMVTWYQGPGWVGWYPQIAPGGGRGSACVRGRSCVIAVSNSNFGRRHPVKLGDVLRVEPSQGRVVSKPSIAPGGSSGFARGSVRVSPGSAGAERSRIRAIGGGTGIAALGPRRAHFGGTAPSVVLPAAASAVLNAPKSSGGAALTGSSSGITFDSRTGRFVNNPNHEPAPASGGGPAGTPTPSASGASVAPRAAESSSAPTIHSSGQHTGFFGRLFGRHNAPASGGGQTSQDHGVPPRMGSTTASSGASASGQSREPAMSSPRQSPAVSAPRSEPSFHSAPASAPPPAPAPSPSFGGGGGSAGGGGFHGGGGASAGGGGGGRAAGGGRTPH